MFKGLLKKRILLIFLINLIILAAIISGCGSTGSSDPQVSKPKTFEMNLTHLWPGGHYTDDWSKDFADAVRQATDGNVRINVYPGNTLVGPVEIYDGVEKGIVDIGIGVLQYSRGRFPVMEALELPGINFQNSYIASQVAWELTKILDPEELKDTKLLMTFATGPGDIFSKKPIRTLEDLQGVEIRATGSSVRPLQLLGAIPVSMAQNEAYEALSRGVVQGNLAPKDTLQVFRHAEVVDYVTETPFIYNAVFFMTMNLDRWNSLPADYQKAIEKVIEEQTFDAFASWFHKYNEVAMNWAMKEHGVELIKLSDEEVDRWLSIVTPLQQEWVESANQRRLPGQKILDTVKELVAKYTN